VPFDRDGTLRKAEKLLRQGKLDLAIAEYRTVVEEQPTDWNTTNMLGDLYVRARQIDKAVAQYTKIADHLATEGFFSKAGAVYKKILKIKPDEERALWELSGIAAKQGLMAEARSSLLTLAQQRGARGDKRGEAEVRVRLGDLDGADVDQRLVGARARVELGDAKTAVERLKAGAAELREKGKTAEAIALLSEAAEIAPDDGELRQLVLQAHVARGDFDSASRVATSGDELKVVAAELFRQGREDEALGLLRRAADMEPTDSALRAQIARMLVARGDVEGARALLTPEVAGSDPELLWMLAEMELRAGRIAEGTALLQQLLADDPSRRDALVILGCSVAEENADAGYECIEVAARAATANDEWASAAAALNEFVNRVPNHIPALMRLVEICVDGGLEATMYSAQAQLADAYLVAGQGLEARVIAEDLVAREPWDRANIERFRRALTLLGESDVDAVIAERLSGQSPFTSTDFMWPAEPGTELTPTPVIAPPEEAAAPARTPPVADEPAAPTPEPPKARRHDAYAIDVDSILAGTSQPAQPEAKDVDLSDVLQELPETEGANAAPPTVEGVLKDMRDQAVHDSSPETAEQHFKLAGTYMQMGMQEDALKALEVAARSPRHRFRAGAMLAKAHLEAGDHARAIEWYERAIEAPAPSAEAYHALLYDLSLVLEAQGESARALAVLLELQAEAGEYRDVSSRLGQLKVQMGS
jgi:tetratricopeptide (TPR) repeat protein